MAINYYDEAVASKIQGWVSDPSIHVLKPEEVSWMLQSKADEGMDKPLTLPFIALSRDTEISLENPNKRPMSYDGLALHLIDSKTGKEVHLKSGYKLNAIPIGMTYQLDVYTKRLAEAEEYVRSFLFNLINYPSIKIDIPYNGVHLEHRSSIRMESKIEDNSDIPQRLYPGQFTRLTIRFMVDDAYMFSVVDRKYVAIDPDSITLDIMDYDHANKKVTHEEIEVIGG